MATHPPLKAFNRQLLPPAVRQATVVGENSLKNRAAVRLQGDDLIAEVLRNLEEGMFRIRGKTLVPSIYRIYLNPADYEPLRDVAPFVAEEIRGALDEQLKNWNQARGRIAAKLMDRMSGRDSNAGTYVRLAEVWTVEVQPDLDNKLAPGEIEIYSELGAPQKGTPGGGSVTRRIFPKPALDAAGADAANDAPPPAPKGLPRGYLRFTDEQGPRVFEMTRNQLVIGRGGRSYWVDLKLETLPDVSREHCRIRCNPESGGFTIEDVSQFGTFVDGKPVGQNAVTPLPARATIDLAGVIELQWEMA